MLGALPKAYKASLTILCDLWYEVSVTLEETASGSRLFLYDHSLIIFGVKNQLRPPLSPHLHEKRVIVINGD